MDLRNGSVRDYSSVLQTGTSGWDLLHSLQEVTGKVSIANRASAELCSKWVKSYEAVTNGVAACETIMRMISN